MRTTTIIRVLAVLACIACPAIAGVTMTNIGSFSIAGTKPATGQVGYYGNAVAFVPAGQDSINQDTLIITWAQTDPINATRRLFLFHRITIVAQQRHADDPGDRDAAVGRDHRRHADRRDQRAAPRT